MKNTPLKLIPIILILFLLGSGCHKEEPLETDPAKNILGKWEMFKKGNITIESPEGYTEYLKDSIAKTFSYQNQEIIYHKYWFDTLLHFVTYYNSGISLQVDYTYEFTDNNDVMILNHVSGLAREFRRLGLAMQLNYCFYLIFQIL